MSKDDFEQLLSHVNVPRETFDRLKLYQDTLNKWQCKINLVGPDTIQDSWHRHFIDSLQLIPWVEDMSLRSVDFGSGAGFPGLALAIAGMSDMHLLESDTKKATFLREAARLTKTTVTVHHERIEQCDMGPVHYIFSRGCSSLDKLFSYSQKYVSRETIGYFHKGKNYPKELLDAKENWMFDYTLFPSVTDTHGAIIRIKNLRKK